MVVLIVFTIIFHLMIDDSYGPLLESLPLTFSDKVAPDFIREPKIQRSVPLRLLDFLIGSEFEDPFSDHGFTTMPAPVSTMATISTSYAHPTQERPPQIVWMAKDRLGLSAAEMLALKEQGIKASTAGAEMNESGKVKVLGAPPDGESRA